MIQIGLKKKKTKKGEKYDFPVLTLFPVKDKGCAHKMVFNKAAIEALGFNDDTKVVFGRDEYYTFLFDGSNLSSEYDSIKRPLTKGDRGIASKDDYSALMEDFAKFGKTPEIFNEIKIVIKESSELNCTIGKLVYMDNMKSITDDDITDEDVLAIYDVNNEKDSLEEGEVIVDEIQEEEAPAVY